MTSSSTPTPVATIDHVSFWYGADPAQRSTYYSPVTPEAPSPESDHTLHEGSSTPRSDAATL
ncbi:MAG: hypothetical protein LKI30_06715, partial [Bifidobacterium crudilactis]|nr:hypothetical protein [Bifidobacterium crudilactis]